MHFGGRPSRVFVALLARVLSIIMNSNRVFVNLRRSRSPTPGRGRDVSKNSSSWSSRGPPPPNSHDGTFPAFLLWKFHSLDFLMLYSVGLNMNSTVRPAS